MGRKDASFDPQLDFRPPFFRPSSLDLYDEFLWSALRLRLVDPFTTYSSVDGGLKCGVATSWSRWYRSRLNKLGFWPILRRGSLLSLEA